MNIKLLAFLLLTKISAFSQWMTLKPNFQIKNSEELSLEKVIHDNLTTTLELKFSFNKKKNSNLLTEVFGLNPSKINVCIRDRSYLLDSTQNKRFEMLRATGIPYCSSGRLTLSTYESVSFKLFFERLPEGLERFDFIEGNFIDSLIFKKSTWYIKGIEATNPAEGQISKVQKYSSNEDSQILNYKIEKENVFYFFESRAKLIPESEEYLKEFFSKYQSALQNSNSIKIEGHTDRIGEFEKNRTLSIARAKLIKNFLVDGGISASKITIKGYSHLKILTEKRDDYSKQLNRRVEIKIL